MSIEIVYWNVGYFIEEKIKFIPSTGGNSVTLCIVQKGTKLRRQNVLRELDPFSQNFQSQPLAIKRVLQLQQNYALSV